MLLGWGFAFALPLRAGRLLGRRSIFVQVVALVTIFATILRLFIETRDFLLLLWSELSWGSAAPPGAWRAGFSTSAAARFAVPPIMFLGQLLVGRLVRMLRLIWQASRLLCESFVAFPPSVGRDFVESSGTSSSSSWDLLEMLVCLESAALTSEIFVSQTSYVRLVSMP